MQFATAMAPLLNSKTASMIDELLKIFRLCFREIPSDVRGIVYFLCSFIFAIIFVNCSAFIFFFILSPIPPHYHPTIKLNSINVTSLDTHAVNLTGTFDITFDFNTSKCNDHSIVSYHDIEVKVWWYGNKDITLATTRLSPFSQRTNSVTKVGSILKVVDGFNNGGDVVKGIASELARGSVNFGVSLFGLVRFEDDSLESLKYVCNQVVVVFPYGSNNGIWKTLGFPCPKLYRKLVI